MKARETMQAVPSTSNHATRAKRGKMLVTQDTFGFAFNWLKKSVFGRIVEQNKKNLLNDGCVTC